MREKVNSNEYSFILKATGETSVIVTVFRKDQEVVSKEFNKLDETTIAQRKYYYVDRII